MRGSSDRAKPGERERDAAIWRLVEQQHGVVARGQLLELDFSARAIERRIASGRLHPVWRGVYAVGRPQLGRHGRWIAATLACGPAAVLSHGSAAILWGFGRERKGQSTSPFRAPPRAAVPTSAFTDAQGCGRRT